MPKKINIKGPIVSNDVGWFYNWLGWDAACPNTLIQGLEEAAGEDVIIEINSPGGVCVYGYEMYTAIKNYEGKVTVHVISAMSAATLLVCAADEALISDTGIFMIHNARSSASGDYRDMQQEADVLREFNAGIINAYVRKTGKSRDEIQALMDRDCFMSPQTAIEHGFIDGYIFGEPEEKTDREALATKIVAADMPVIAEDKVREIMNLLKLQKVAPVQPETVINSRAVVDKENSEGGTKNMTLAEFLAENPEAQVELDSKLAQAEAKGTEKERARIQSLDKIAETVDAKMLDAAKYGENPMTGQELAYQALVEGKQTAAAYMAAAQADSAASGAENVGIGTPDVGEETTDESDELAGYINARKAGR